MIKRILFVLVIMLALLVLWHFELVQYGMRQGIGQLKIVYNAKPIQEFLDNPDVEEETKRKLRLIQAVRTYAIDRLGLADTENYTTMYDQQGKPLLWVVTGCEPYQFNPYQWHFPVLGSVPYKGFFRQDLAQAELERLKQSGYDAGIRTVGGWSTLGWFNDPILSEMLKRNDGDLANLIIHELVHATIFVKDSVEFNENLASFIADKGTELYLKEQYGAESTQLVNYRYDLLDEKKLVKHILTGYQKLDSLYQQLDSASDSTKANEKEKMISRIMINLDTLIFHDPNYIDHIKGYQPNNTYFMSFKRYQSKQNMLDSLFYNEYNADVRNFIHYLKQKHPSL